MFLVGFFVSHFMLLELTEKNNLQFMYAACLPLSLLLLRYWEEIKEKVEALILAIQKHVLIIFSSVWYAAFNGSWNFSITKCYQVVICLFTALSTAPYLINAAKCLTSTQGSHQFLKESFYSGYKFLEKIPDHGSVMFGTHYQQGKFTGSLHVDNHFIRSALSGRKFFVEGSKYKGVIMQQDFAKREAFCLAFFKNFVVSSEDSQRKFDARIEACSHKEKFFPMSQSPSFYIRILGYLSLGKEWHYFNTLKKVQSDLYDNFVQLVRRNLGIQEYISYLRKFDVKFIVLENGDTIRGSVLQYFDLKFQNKEICIYEI